MANDNTPTPAVNAWGEPVTSANRTTNDARRETAQDANRRYTASVTGTPTPVTAKDPAVFLGFTPVTDADRKEARMEGAATLPDRLEHTRSASSVANQFYDWDQRTKDAFISQVALTGREVDDMTDGQLADLWANYVGQAAAYYRGGAGQRITPWDIISKDMKSRERAVAKTIKARTVTTTSASTDLSSALSARAIFQQASQALLGRAPTASESKAFQARLNAYEKANPAVTTTTTNYAGGVVGEPGTGEATSQKSTTSGGVQAADRAMIAEEAAKVDPEYGAYQAATNGMNWLMEMVSGG